MFLLQWHWNHDKGRGLDKMTINMKVELRKTKCPDCKSVVHKNGLTTNGKYQRYICKSCKKQWIELMPAKPQMLREYLGGYD